MKSASLLLALTLSFAFVSPAFAQDSGAADASVAMVVDAGTVDVPVAELAAVPVLDNPLPFFKVVFEGVKTGNWWIVASALLVVIVSLLRTYGKKLHEALADTNILDKPLWFLLETKPGGWLMNALTAVAGACGAALLAGEPVTWAILKPVMLVSGSGAALWELYKDISGWLTKKSVPAAAAQAASEVPTPAPTPTSKP